jgi:glycosyltransferase involved in cell wall biosynthesis
VPLESLFPPGETSAGEASYPGEQYPERPYPGHRSYPGEQAYPGDGSYPGEESCPGERANRAPGEQAYPAPGDQAYPAPPGEQAYPAGGGEQAYQAGRSYGYRQPPREPASPYDTPPVYGAPPVYDTPAYDATSAFGAPSSYETRPAHDAPPEPGPFGAEPSYPSSSSLGTAPPPQPEPPDQVEPRYRGAPPDGRAPHVSIVLPCFNEQDHVLREVERISQAMDASGLPYELIAVDDASTDATLERLRAAEPNLPRMRVVHFPRNGGAGTVRRIGTQQAKGEVVVWTDADMTYPNERIPEFVAMLDTDPAVDQVVGARTSEEGTHKIARVPAKWFIRKLAEKLTNSQIPDLNSGLRAFRRDVAEPYLRLLPPGFSCVTTITLAFLSNQHTVTYVPIDYAKRAGVSKFRFVSDAYRYILQVLRMVMYFNPLKVLMPVALFLLSLGILKGIYDMVVHPFYFAINTVLIFVTGLIIASMALLADLIVRSRGDT